MKNYALMYFFVFMWCAFTPVLFATQTESLPDGEESACSAEVSESQEEKQPIYLTVYLKDSNTAARLELEEYVARALTAVMDDTAPSEALKAQAVAIRSVALFSLNNPRHTGYDLCGDHLHCCPVAETAADSCVQAAADTKGLALFYNGSPALALSHLSSSVSTEAASQVLGEDYPYLSVVPAEDESGFSCYKTQYTFDKNAFAAAFSDYAVSFGDDHKLWVGKQSFSGGSRVTTVKVGGVNFKGSTFAGLLGLDSLCFTVSPTEDGFFVTCYGSGSGLGMSRCSAVLMALRGETCEKILSYFYKDTVLQDI